MNTHLTTNNTNKSLSTTSVLDLEFIKKQFFPIGATAQDMEYCLKVANIYELNPITREIFFVERNAKINGQWVTKVDPLVSRDGLLSIAHKSSKFGGIKSESFLKETPILVNGQWEVKKDLCAIAQVYRTDTKEVFSSEVYYSEYVQKTKQGEITRFWAEKPNTMLKKVAESQALRKAFNINGMYIPEEIGVVNSVGGGSENLGDIDIVIADDESIEAEIPESFNDVEVPNNLKMELKAIEALGLKAIEKNGFLKIEGNTFKKEKQIQTLGFSLHTSADGEKIWVKKIA